MAIENEELMQYPEIWKKIHSKLAEHGFILRYPENKTDVTGYAYESWHYRFVGIDAATYIHKNNITLEEYLGK